MKTLLAFVLCLGLALPIFAQSRFVRYVTNVTDLARINPSGNDLLYELLGRDAINDGGGGTIYWTPGSAATTNKGTIIASTVASGRFIRPIEGPVNVLWFGAKRDATASGSGTDSTDAINDALANYDNVFFPGGSDTNIGYKVTAPLKLARNFMNIYGSGVSSTLFAATAGLNIFSNSSGGVINNIRFDNLAGQCVDNIAAGSFLYLLNVNDSAVLQPTVRLDSGSTTTGFLVPIWALNTTNTSGGYRLRIDTPRLRGITSTNYKGIYFTANGAGYGNNSVLITGGSISVAGGGNAVHTENTQGVHVEGVTIEGEFNPAIRFDGFSGVSLNSSTKDLWIETSSGSYTNGIWFNGDGCMDINTLFSSGVTRPYISTARTMWMNPSATGGNRIFASTGQGQLARLGVAMGGLDPIDVQYDFQVGGDGTSKEILLSAGGSSTAEVNLWGGTSNRLWNVKFDDNTNAYRLAFSLARTDGNHRTNQFGLSGDGTGNSFFNGGLYIGTNYVASLPGENNLWVENYIQLADGAVKLSSGTGSPEGVLARDPGSLYFDRNGNTWIKVTGAGNTGWSFYVPSSTFLSGSQSFYFLRGDGAGSFTWADNLRMLTNSVDGPNVFFDKRGAAAGSTNDPPGSGSALGSIWFRGWDGFAWATGAVIRAQTTETFGALANGTKLQFATHGNGSSGSPVVSFEVQGDGKVLFGNSANPTVDTLAQWTFDNNIYGANRGAFLSFDGTSNIVHVAYTANDPPANGDLLQFSTSCNCWTNVPASSISGNNFTATSFQALGTGTDFTYGASDTFEKIQFGTTGPSFVITNAGTYQVLMTVAASDAASFAQTFYLTNVTDSVGVAGSYGSVLLGAGSEGTIKYPIMCQVTTSGSNKTFELWGKTADAAPTQGIVVATNTVLNVIRLY